MAGIKSTAFARKYGTSQESVSGPGETNEAADQLTPLLVVEGRSTPALVIQRRREYHARRAYFCIVIFLLCLVILAFLFYLLFMLAIWCAWSCGLGPLQAPIAAPKNWTDFSPQSFTVGFDLTAGYGYAR
jgi:hypothetical protein